MGKRFSWKIGLSMTLVFALLIAGCSGGNVNTGGKEKTKEENKEEAVKEERGNITVSIYDRGSVPPEEGTAENNRWTKWMSENGPANVKFVPVPRWESKEKFNVMFASSKAPDLIFEYDTAYRNELIAQKQLMPLNDLIEEHSVEYKALLEKYPILRKVATREDGNMYEFARLNGLMTNHLLFVRQDWLEKLSLSVPKTMEEFYEVAEAFVKQDPDNNGKTDTLAMGVTMVGGVIIDQMFQDVAYKVKDGAVVRTWENSIAKNNFLKKLYDNALIDKDFLTDKNGEKAKQDFINGKLGFYGVNGGEAYATFSALKANLPDAKVMAISLPASEFGQFGPIINNPVQGTAAINANAKDPVAVMKYVDFLVRESTMKTLQFGIENEHYKMGESGCPTPIDAEKNQKELGWMADYRMLVSGGLFGDCGSFKHQLDPNNPVDQEYMAIMDQADAAYLNPKAPFAEMTHGEHKPTIPKELQLINTNTREQITSMYQQSLIGGSKYTVEQAAADAQAYWEKSGGKQVEDWYTNWYVNHSADAIMTKDLYEIKID
ncbi:ABC transporter substrate-binding protein [Paenibacillus agaridevorans]|uniref:ABC transporter substrate-binding protein n=1 Tax=Paenibacillus agaridevorans TaxID=171404 RepID=A0A2R5EN91_9BACL|nr:extracellular solute-binding protein [Paenibacillus agaridevorans]GBG07119.1 ABC transporter substrate-binding protein [Paenibacillus agaridevorans]